MKCETRVWKQYREREGFSLVELIIVIAIMAILIGVVALAVIPYLEKTRETKDLATMDSVCSALVMAVATSGSLENSPQVFKYDGITNPGPGTGMEKVSSAMYNSLGGGNIVLTSSRMKDAGTSVYCCYDTSNGKIYVFAGTDESTVKNFSRIKSGYQDDMIPPVQMPDGRAAIVSSYGRTS